MPPSTNNLYYTASKRNIGFGKGVRRYRTESYKVFQETMRQWSMVVGREAKQFSIEMWKWIEGGQYLHLDRFYIFPKGKVFAQNHRGPRKLDTSNRDKALDDSLGAILGVDDSYFFSGSHEKIVDEEQNREFACVHVKPCRERTRGDFEILVKKDKPGGYFCKTLRIGEGVSIGEGFVRVVVRDVTGTRVSLAIAAPSSLRIRNIESETDYED